MRLQSWQGYVFLFPALLAMTLCAIVPMGFVIYYSFHDTFGGNSFIWVGTDWYQSVISSRDFHNALLRSLCFSALVLVVEIPLGLFVALKMPTSGLSSTLLVVLIAVPLLCPPIVVGHLWNAMILPKAGLLSETASALGLSYNINKTPMAWTTLVLMDVWHWTSLVVLLCYAALRGIPVDYYRAAQIDGASRWSIFRFIQLPKLRTVLLIAILLRFMDSFMIYTETYVITRGGPGVSTIFLSHELVQTSTVEFNLGEGAAMATIYFLIILCVSWALFQVLQPRQKPLQG